jgi:excisionase family DNA binding protein
LKNLSIPAMYFASESFNSSEVQSRSRRFLTPEQAADFLGGLNSRTVTRWAREGYLPAVPVGEGKRRLWRFREIELERWMLSRYKGWTSSDSHAPSVKLVPAADAPIGGN